MLGLSPMEAALSFGTILFLVGMPFVMMVWVYFKMRRENDAT